MLISPNEWGHFNHPDTKCCRRMQYVLLAAGQSVAQGLKTSPTSQRCTLAMRGDGTAVAGQTGSSGNHPYSDDPNNPAPLHDG